MTRLYIANTTPQDRRMYYRMLEVKDPSFVDIPRGAQTAIPREMTSDEISYVVQQQELYGMVAASDVGHTRSHIYALYSIGKPVTQAQMQQALDRNLVLMGEEGLRLRKMAAVGISNTLQEQHPENYMGARVEIVDKREDQAPVVNELHRYRRDGDYNNRAPADIFQPETTPIKKGRGRPRKVIQ